jgi:pimeloyl-ACP methyl ester carboxylesterase
MRCRTDADRRARAAAIATSRSPAGVTAMSEMWGSFTLPGHDLRTRAGTISAPTVIVWGRHDPVLSSDNAGGGVGQ